MLSARRILIVAYDDSQILDVACPSGALDLANRHGADPPYEIELGTVGRAPARSSAGIALGACRSLEEVAGPLDTLLVAGGGGYARAAADTRLVTQVRRLARASRRVASVCTGAYVLAAAGLLDHRRATTHWRYGAELAARHPAVAVDTAPLYIRDGNVYTAAGVTSALDLTLSLIEDDHGPTLARAVARELVSYLHRPADQAQISMFLAAPPPGDRLVRDLAVHIAAHLAEDLSPAALAARAGVSTRHLTRLFAAHLGTTPARAVRAARTEAAAHLVRSSALPLAAIARRCGFGSAQTLRQAFLDAYGVSGDTMRKMPDMPRPRAGSRRQTPGA
ncbi:AraC family transcriptional regulator [Streptomyces spectabilis]|uniref:Helix-turn-helix domain-containing protein n=1 Tax=Streptomyces spectabilis TaxID=68270 RepID=A0A5P2XBA8_STRST|nr:DJ-1/PfpI family protein [Streptomyces spectabilis]MBB5106799.1 transcriptional regulator GlxA family with amidase domain [Streptomyces spectabilis]MCI3903350.1 DJ-1/PfpI family protein [Streptomyces spectabilis]QEV60569.1 helix-turn-helix domain-containing protein [Streptomyces spectabilis]GGV43900.1 AraC family transcriptional regulator [Streptomyces spectabilis]